MFILSGYDFVTKFSPLLEKHNRNSITTPLMLCCEELYPFITTDDSSLQVQSSDQFRGVYRSLLFVFTESPKQNAVLLLPKTHDFLQIPLTCSYISERPVKQIGLEAYYDPRTYASIPFQLRYLYYELSDWLNRFFINTNSSILPLSSFNPKLEKEITSYKASELYEVVGDYETQLKY